MGLRAPHGHSHVHRLSSMRLARTSLDGRFEKRGESPNSANERSCADNVRGHHS